MGKYTFRHIALLVCLVFSLISCRQDKSRTTPSQLDQTVYISTDKDPERLSPLIYPLSAARIVNQNIFMPLADFDPFTYEFVPLLIKSIPKGQPYGDTGVKYDIEFIDIATWSDGTPITADDYIFTLKLVLHPLTVAKSARSSLSSISKVEKDPSNNKKFTVYFDEDYSQSIEAAVSFELYPQHIYDPNDDITKVNLSQIRDTAWINSAVLSDSSLITFAEQINSQKYSRDIVSGAGPYELVDWIPEEAIVLKRKDNYWAKGMNKSFYKQNPATIVIKIIPDEVSAIAQLKSGLIDFVPNLSAESYSLLKADSTLSNRYKYYENSLMRYYFIALNNQHPVLQSKNARKALAHATNVKQYIDVLENGMGKQTTSFVNPSKKYYNNNIEPIEFDINKSKELLAQDGWKDRNRNGVVDKVINGQLVEFSIKYYASGKLGVDIGLLLKEDAKQAGMEIEVIKQSNNITKKENLGTGDYGMLVSALTQSLGLDDPTLRFHSDNAVLGGNNYAMYNNPRVDQLCTIIKETSDEQDLKKAFDEIQEIIYDEQPILFLYVPKSRYLSNDKWDLKVSPKRPGFFPNTFDYVPVMIDN